MFAYEQLYNRYDGRNYGIYDDAIDDVEIALFLTRENAEIVCNLLNNTYYPQHELSGKTEQVKVEDEKN